MSDHTSPSIISLSIMSPSMDDFAESSASSRSSTSSEHDAFFLDVINPSTASKSEEIPWILHRILECQLWSELPLRIMFAYNSGQKLPTLQQARDFWAYSQQGKLLIAFLSSLEKITPSINDVSIQNPRNCQTRPLESVDQSNNPSDRFMDTGNDHLLGIESLDIEKGRRQSDGLPQAFVEKTCLKQIFPENFDDADFALALTGLDYLRDLEITRRTSLREAAMRLGITKETWRDVLTDDPDAKRWVERMQKLELDVSTYYATIFIDLRVWTLIKELQSEPFYKPNLLAMLNTLFPPSIRELPNDKIDEKVMHNFRAHFYEYILAVEKHGPKILNPWIEGKLRIGSRHSWPDTRRNMILYFEAADDMIETSNLISDMYFFRAEQSCVSRSTTSLSISTHSDISESRYTYDTRHESSTEPSKLALSGKGSSSPTKLTCGRPATSQDSGNSLTDPLCHIHQRPATAQSSYSIKSRKVPLQERPATSQGHNKCNGHGSQEKQMSEMSSIQPYEVGSVNFYEADEPLHYRPKISSPEPNMYFEQPKSPWLPSHGPKRSIGSIQSERIAMPPNSRPNTPTYQPPAASNASTRDRTLSRPFTPLREESSEASRHPSFTRPITPFEQRRQEVIDRREAVSNQSRTSSELRHAQSHASLGTLHSRAVGKAHSIKGQTSLQNDGFDFLKRPYEELPTPILKKKSSFSSIFSLRKKSSKNSLATMPEDTPTEFRTASTRKESQSTSISTETFPRFSQDAPSSRSGGLSFTKQVSFTGPDNTDYRTSTSTSRSRAPSGHPSLYVGDDDKASSRSKRSLRSKTSLPNLTSKSKHEDRNRPPGMRPKFVAAGNDYEAIALTHVPVTPPSKIGFEKQQTRKEVRKAKSFAALRSGFGASTASTDAKRKKRERDRAFRKEPTEGEVLRGKMISEPFVVSLKDSPASMTEETRDKEWTRRWLIEDAKAKKMGMTPPVGEPLSGGEKVVVKGKKGVQERVKEFEFPRATPKAPSRPDRQKWESIFPRRGVEGKKTSENTPVNTGNYSGYPGRIL